MKQLFVFVLILMLGSISGFSQSYEDSLLNIITESNTDVSNKEAKFLLGEYLVQRNPEQAEIYANDLTSLISIEKDSSEWARLNYIFAASHRWQGNYKTALAYYHENYDYYNRLTDEVNIAKSGHFIGSINLFLGNNIVAQKHLLECAEIYDRVGTTKQRGQINNVLASFYSNIDQTDKALERYLIALEEFTSINDSAGMSSINANLGLLYSELGDYEKSEAHLLQQKELNKVFPTLREMGFHHDFMGILRERQGLYDEAYKEYLMGLKIRENLSSTYNLCESKISIGGLLIKQGKFNEAIDHLNDVLSFDEHESYNQQTSAHELLSEAYEKQHKYEKALAHYKLFKAVSDTIYNEESIQIIAEKDAQYKKKEQDAEIAILNKEKVIAEQKLTRSRILIGGSLIGLIIFSLLSFFIYQLYLKIKSKNQVIKKALSDKDLLIHEIHHRVKNNLQIISSLLKLQSRFITDPNALEAIQDGRNRVQSMAILHKNLYREENLTGVDMQTYFTSLIEGIFKSYNLKNEKIGLDMDIDAINLDIDTVIPIGLITNELITNSLKYAFEEGKQSAMIKVKLKELNNNYELVVSDNGIGITDQEMNQVTTTSFGQKMIKTFVQKLKGSIVINNQSGTEVTINIPKLV